jgi:hypothetical protein
LITAPARATRGLSRAAVSAASAVAASSEARFWNASQVATSRAFMVSDSSSSRIRAIGSATA